MDDRSARHDLALVAVTMVGLSRLLEPPVIWLVAAALLGAMLLGTLQVLTDEVHPSQAWFGIPIESLILPSVAAVACLGAIRLVPFGLWLVPALGITWLIVGRTLTLEARLNRDQRPAHGGRPDGAPRRRSCSSRSSAFTGVAAMVPGGLAQAGGALGESNLLVLAAADALVAGLLGYRAASLRVTTVRDALWSAATYAAAIAIGAAALRAMEIPRLDRARPPDPRLLPVGCVHQHRAVTTPRHALDRADRRSPGSGPDRGRLEPAPPRLRIEPRRASPGGPSFDVPRGRC